ncbi:UNVERIFIED_CONTAM: hypothetical protein FKN15_039022 [Acipenser sinensis]
MLGSQFYMFSFQNPPRLYQRIVFHSQCRKTAETPNISVWGGLRSARVSSAHCAPATPVDWSGACEPACKRPRAVWSSNAVALR